MTRTTITNPADLISEREWQQTVEGLLTLYGWRWYHTHDSRRSVAGFPDIFATKGVRAIALELKSEAGKPTAAQSAWLDALEATGIWCHVVYPSGRRELEAMLREDYP